MATVKWAVWGSCGIAKLRTIPEGIVPAGNAELVSIYDVNTAVIRLMAYILCVVDLYLVE